MAKSSKTSRTKRKAALPKICMLGCSCKCRYCGRGMPLFSKNLCCGKHINMKVANAGRVGR